MNELERNHRWVQLIGFLGGTRTTCSSVENGKSPTLDTLGNYLGVVYGDRKSYFPLLELVTPRHEKTASLLGYAYLIPQTDWFPRVAALRLVADALRELVDEPVKVANLWRPQDYNRLVPGTADNSTHVDCCAIDLDFQSRRSRDIALKKFLEPLWLSPINFDMGLGVGGVRIHVDFLSPEADKREANGERRNRWWAYPTAKDYKGPGR